MIYIEFGVTYSTARRWLREYRRANGLSLRNHWFAKLVAAGVSKPGREELESMTRDQLIDEVIKARVEAERAKKWYAARGGGTEKEFFSLDGASLK